MTDRLPIVLSGPDHAPLAVHELALVADQVIVTELPGAALDAEAFRVMQGAGELLLPPVPHEVTMEPLWEARRFNSETMLFVAPVTSEVFPTVESTARIRLLMVSPLYAVDCCGVMAAVKLVATATLFWIAWTSLP